MKKLMFTLAIAVIIGLSLSSCKKCIKCELTGGMTKTYPETCGSNDDLDAVEDECVNAALAQHAVNNPTTCSCTDQ